MFIKVYQRISMFIKEGNGDHVGESKQNLKKKGKRQNPLCRVKVKGKGNTQTRADTRPLSTNGSPQVVKSCHPKNTQDGVQLLPDTKQHRQHSVAG